MRPMALSIVLWLSQHSAAAVTLAPDKRGPVRSRARPRRDHAEILMDNLARYARPRQDLTKRSRSWFWFTEDRLRR